MANKRKAIKREHTIKIITTILVVIMLLTTILPSIVMFVSAATSDEIKEQIKQIEKEQKDLETQVEELEQQKIENVEEIKDLMAQKTILDQQISALDEQIQLVDKKISAQALLIADKQDELDVANEKLVVLRAENKERLRTLEENGNVSYWSVINETWRQTH